MQNIGENIKKVRFEKKLSQEQMSKQLGVSRQSISKWENNHAYPDIEKIIKMSFLFNVSIDSLVLEKNNTGEERFKTVDMQSNYMRSVYQRIFIAVSLFSWVL
ncbi:helix-turn-helix domain-containing protein [Levilactobacillus sp. N40-8-2]|uniref:helix-turn-helix domain-containing protein n=1 Tax=Levilactobacillus muriae TaxID=3238987 RepID=UPI0038B3FA08